MSFYIASHSREKALLLKDALETQGHSVQARWITADQKFERGLKAYTDDERRQLALMDEEDVRASEDGLIVIAEQEGITVPGGKHVETGIALALERAIYVIGRRENVFHWHPRARVFDSDRGLLDYLVQ